MLLPLCAVHPSGGGIAEALPALHDTSAPFVLRSTGGNQKRPIICVRQPKNSVSDSRSDQIPTKVDRSREHYVRKWSLKLQRVAMCSRQSESQCQTLPPLQPFQEGRAMTRHVSHTRGPFHNQQRVDGTL